MPNSKLVPENLRDLDADIGYCANCDESQSLYAHARTRRLFCSVCDTPYDERKFPKERGVEVRK